MHAGSGFASATATIRHTSWSSMRDHISASQRTAVTNVPSKPGPVARVLYATGVPVQGCRNHVYRTSSVPAVRALLPQPRQRTNRKASLPAVQFDPQTCHVLPATRLYPAGSRSGPPTEAPQPHCYVIGPTATTMTVWCAGCSGN